MLGHLRGVAALASEFAIHFDAAPQAELAGLWHDLGKYAQDFQDMLHDAAVGDAASAHIEGDNDTPKKRVDHSAAGAFHVAKINPGASLPLVFAIAGHHAGLADWPKLKERLRDPKRGQARFDAMLKGKPPPELLDYSHRRLHLEPARILDPHRIVPVESHGCRLAW